MPWLHGLKARHEQQKEHGYLKNKPLLKTSNYFWNACKELLLEKNNLVYRLVFRTESVF